MQQLFLYALIIALKNTAIHVLFWEGMLLGGVRISLANRFDKLFGLTASKYIQKPIYDCLPCMASMWTVFWLIVDGATTFNIWWLEIVLIVCGISVLIDSALPNVCGNPENREI